MPGHQLFHVAVRTSPDHAPDGPVVDAQQAVIVEEAHEEPRRHAPHDLRLRGPDRRSHGQDVLLDEGTGVAALFEVITEWNIGRFGPQQLRRRAVEAQDVREHAVEGRAQQVAALGEQAVQRRALVLQARAVMLDAEAHVAVLPADPQFIQQRQEIRIGALVEHDETRVHRVSAPRVPDVDGMGMAADATVRLVHGDIVLAREVVSRDVARDPGSYDRDLHRSRPPAGFCAIATISGAPRVWRRCRNRPPRENGEFPRNAPRRWMARGP